MNYYERIAGLKEETVFDINERGFNIKAYYLKNSEELGIKGEALVEVTYNNKVVRRILWPAYKIWNIAAHAHDIVDAELSMDDKERGYSIAGSDGLGGNVYTPDRKEVVEP